MSTIPTDIIDFDPSTVNSFKNFRFSNCISVNDLRLDDDKSLSSEKESSSDPGSSDLGSSGTPGKEPVQLKKVSYEADMNEQRDNMIKDIVFYHERCVVNCTPSIAFGKPMQDYINGQVSSGKNRWIYEILDGNRENESILVETDDFVFLPDTHAINNGRTYNWLAIVKDRSLRTLRDLDARHISMLRKMKMTCVDYIQSVTQHNAHNVMAYVHYLPSVYQLHVHFCAPYGCYTTIDPMKMYPLDSIISNLTIDGAYFKKANITTVIYGNVNLLNIYNLPASLANASSKFAIDLKRGSVCPCCKNRCNKCRGKKLASLAVGGQDENVPICRARKR
eukprot:753585-Hanusia_phi.AAC.3